MHLTGPRNPETQRLTIVLTGGIASGKTAVSDIFEKLGVSVIDTDVIAREIVQPGCSALTKIEKEFGRDFLHGDGSLDRSKMRKAVFSDPDAKSRLEAILHPAIAVEVSERVKKLESLYCILVIPLFFESSSYDWVDRVLVVDVPEDLQIERVLVRDGVSWEQAQSILAAQASREERLAVADDVILNSGSIEELEKWVLELHQEYLSLAGC